MSQGFTTPVINGRDTFRFNGQAYLTEGGQYASTSGASMAWWGKTPAPQPVISNDTTSKMTLTQMSGALWSLVKALSGAGIITGNTV